MNRQKSRKVDRSIDKFSLKNKQKYGERWADAMGQTATFSVVYASASCLSADLLDNSALKTV